MVVLLARAVDAFIYRWLAPLIYHPQHVDQNVGKELFPFPRFIPCSDPA
jgi:hypothetical protein